MLHRYDLADQFKVDPTRIAQTLRISILGKALGANTGFKMVRRGSNYNRGILSPLGIVNQMLAWQKEIYRQGFSR